MSGAALSPWRMELRRTAGGALVLNDAYNANPTSMRAALETLAALPGPRRRAVVGVMAELDDPGPEHLAIAEEAARLDIELIAVGTDLYGIAPVADPVAAVGPLGPGRRRAGQGLAGGRPRSGRRPAAGRLIAPDTVRPAWPSAPAAGPDALRSEATRSRSKRAEVGDEDYPSTSSA